MTAPSETSLEIPSFHGTRCTQDRRGGYRVALRAQRIVATAQIFAEIVLQSLIPQVVLMVEAIDTPLTATPPQTIVPSFILESTPTNSLLGSLVRCATETEGRSSYVLPVRIADKVALDGTFQSTPVANSISFNASRCENLARLAL
jgi:hypothetical protein